MKLLEWLKTQAENEALKAIPADVMETLTKAAEGLKAEILVNDTEAQSYVPKNRLDEVVKAKNTYKEQADEFGKKLKDLEKVAGDAEAFKKQAEELQQSIKDNETKVAEITRDAKIEVALASAKARPEVIGLIDKSKIEILSDGTIKGLEDQLTSLKTTKNYLFEEVTPPQVGGTPPAVPPNPNQNPNQGDLSWGDAIAQHYQAMTTKT